MTDLRRRLLRATGWFAVFCALVAMLLGSQYLSHYPWPRATDAQIYTILAYFSHFAALALLPWLVFVLPLCLLLARPRVVLPLTVLAAALGLSWLLLDALLFSEHQFHLNSLTITILDTHTWAFGGLYLLIFTALGGLVMRRVWQATPRPAHRLGAAGIVISVVASLLGAQAMHVWADANYYVPITRLTHYLPVYQPATAKGFLVRQGWVDLNQNRERQLLERVGREPIRGLYYPQAALHCDAPPRGLYNLLMIIVDAMRADMLDTRYTPNITRFSRAASRFERHFSGGNSSRMGIFSMFYGLPPTYWQNIEALQIPAVMVTQLQQRDYRLGVFGSAPIYRPVSLDRTVFAEVPDLRLETKTPSGLPSENDRRVTDEWKAWLDTGSPGSRFFGFIYYDAPTSKDFPPDYSSQFAPLEETASASLAANYQTSVHYTDSLVGEVLDDLSDRGLLDSTVVMISADHGEAFDDDGQGFDGHGTAYNQAQLQVPMVVHWPGREPRAYQHRSSHNDWVVTVLQDLLGCVNPGSDYSSGKSLFDPVSWPWLIAGSYHNFAILAADQVIVSQFSGAMEVRDANYQLIDDPVLDRGVISAALAETNRFYRRP